MKKREIDLQLKSILVTGGAGFIGAAVCKRLVADYPNATIVAADNLNDYYDVSLKKYRIQEIVKCASSGEPEKNVSSEIQDLVIAGNFVFVRINTADKAAVRKLFDEYRFSVVIHLAAQAGVRYSIDHPDAYIESNVIGFYHVLEACRSYPVEHFVFASSSSVYGANNNVPFSVDDRTDQPLSLYAATKKSDEIMAYAYAGLHSIPTTGLRFFTVYGPAGRPDMAYFSFTTQLRLGKRISLFNAGKCLRDFTYIDDIVEGISRIIKAAPDNQGAKDPPYQIYNIGSSNPKYVAEFIQILVEELKRAGILPDNFLLNEHVQFSAMQQGDMLATYADVSSLIQDFGYQPTTELRDGLRHFAIWYKEYYKILPEV